MKEIAFDSLLLIAADDVSQQAINQLRSEGIYSIENRSCTLINMVVVSTAEGAEHIHQVLENHERARKNVVVKMTPELSIKDESDIDSILSFLPEPGCNPYMELKHFCRCIRRMWRYMVWWALISEVSLISSEERMRYLSILMNIKTT